MHGLTDEQTDNSLPSDNVSTDTHSEDNRQVDASYGKFKTADALYSAYQELEKEFTKKCQRLKELSSNNAADVTNAINGLDTLNKTLTTAAANVQNCANNGLAVDNTSAPTSTMSVPSEIINDATFLNKYVYNNDDIKNYFITAYLEGIVEKKLPKCVTSKGKTLLTPIARPKSLVEAGKIAQDFLDNRRL